MGSCIIIFLKNNVNKFCKWHFLSTIAFEHDIKKCQETRKKFNDKISMFWQNISQCFGFFFIFAANILRAKNMISTALRIENPGEIFVLVVLVGMLVRTLLVEMKLIWGYDDYFNWREILKNLYVMISTEESTDVALVKQVNFIRSQYISWG